MNDRSPPSPPDVQLVTFDAIMPAAIAVLLLNGLYRFWWTVCLKHPSPW